MGEEEQRARSFPQGQDYKDEDYTKTRLKSKQVWNFVKVSTTKKQAPQTYMRDSTKLRCQATQRVSRGVVKQPGSAVNLV